MAGRRVVVTVTESESATGRGAEGLRAGVGLARGLHGHQVRMVFRGSGVKWMLDGERRPPVVAAIISHLEASHIPCYVDAADLESQGLPAGRLSGVVQVVDAGALQQVLDDAECRLVY